MEWTVFFSVLQLIVASIKQLRERVPIPHILNILFIMQINVGIDSLLCYSLDLRILL